mmetsp:Transcript_140684/g.255769  ORF Transcript_140684/g.255769 Transcript_140684/m.255769 type:complete len:81 (+) Transcript_140684:126-368(+)
MTLVARALLGQQNSSGPQNGKTMNKLLSWACQGGTTLARHHLPKKIWNKENRLEETCLWDQLEEKGLCRGHGAYGPHREA